MTLEAVSGIFPPLHAGWRPTPLGGGGARARRRRRVDGVAGVLTHGGVGGDNAVRLANRRRRR